MLREILRTTVALLAPAVVATLVAAYPAGAAEADRSQMKAEYRRPAEVPFPPENPWSEAKAKLGEMLFFDPLLSGSGKHACASCHEPSLAWGDGRARAVGEAQKPLALRSPTLLGVAWTPILGWDGKFRTLESVAYAPILNPANMNGSEEMVAERLAAIPAYRAAFAAAFPDDGAITRRNVEQALATFERTIVPAETPFDRWIAGDENAIGEAAKRGFDIFNGKARCAECHSGWNFTDQSFHDIGTAQGKDIGRGRLFPNDTHLAYAFKVPTLREVGRRAPYMHDGSVATLAEVIDLYKRGGVERPSRSELIEPFSLSAAEEADLLAFLETLNSEPKPHARLELPR